MKTACGILVFFFCLAMVAGLTKPAPPEQGVDTAVLYFKKESAAFGVSAATLQKAIAAIQAGKPNTVLAARRALQNCRVQYKRIEFFLEYFFKTAAIVYNGPPKSEVEEPYMEYEEPIGLQVIEGLLFEKNVAAKKAELLQQAEAISSSATDLGAMLYGFHANDKQLLESVRLELIRIITLGITGYDAPLLKSGIAESAAALGAMQEILHPFLGTGAPASDSVSVCLAGGLRFLQLHRDFDSFDRLGFLTQYALPLQRHFGLLVKALQLEQPATGGVLNYDAGDIFNTGAIDIQSFPGASRHAGTAAILLGRKLFFERGLSGNHKISCATCHDPAKHFTDALAKSVAFDGHSHVQRNAASLLYAGFQYEQFWDGRAKSLEEQVSMVMANPQEMKGDTATILSLLLHQPEYKPLFREAFPGREDSLVPDVATAIAAFVRSLNPRNSKFDQYMQGNASALTKQQAHGFNLFMGKAQCGTCHFAPLFNGLTPPLYNVSELEVLGTTKTDNLDKPEPDTDQGRFNIFPIGPYEKAFKTPTVRNVSATGPYMHNGAFRTLEAVVQFYNKGGGKGLGLSTSSQTLASAPLHLTDSEVSDIVQFLRSLEDTISIQSP